MKTQRRNNKSKSTQVVALNMNSPYNAIALSPSTIVRTMSLREGGYNTLFLYLLQNRT